MFEQPRHKTGSGNKQKKENDLYARGQHYGLRKYSYWPTGRINFGWSSLKIKMVFRATFQKIGKWILEWISEEWTLRWNLQCILEWTLECSLSESCPPSFRSRFRVKRRRNNSLKIHSKIHSTIHSKIHPSKVHLPQINSCTLHFAEINFSKFLSSKTHSFKIHPKTSLQNSFANFLNICVIMKLNNPFLCWPVPSAERRAWPAAQPDRIFLWIARLATQDWRQIGFD